MVDLLGDEIVFYKVDLGLQLAGGDRFAQELKKQEKMVFLDYKYYDIEETIKNAVARAAEIGIDFLRSAGTHRGRRGRSVGGVIDFPRQRFRRPMASGLTARPNRSLLALLALLAGILQT
jgi:hypothetical protein